MNDDVSHQKQNQRRRNGSLFLSRWDKVKMRSEDENETKMKAQILREKRDARAHSHSHSLYSFNSQNCSQISETKNC